MYSYMYGLSIVPSIVICLIVILILLMAARKMRDLVELKGHNAAELHIFAWCFWFPLFGYLYVIALPDLNLHKQNGEIVSNIISDKPEDDNCWICKKCGLKNPKTRMTCQKCDTYKNAHL